MPDDLTRVIAEATEGKDREGTARWPECCRDTYSLAIEEVAAALAPVIEARVREARADAWDEGFQAATDETPTGYAPGWSDEDNPYRYGHPPTGDVDE